MLKWIVAFCFDSIHVKTPSFCRANLHISTDITLGPVHIHNFLINISQNKVHGLRKVRDIPHLELGTIPQKEDNVSVSKQSLDRSDLNHIGVDNLCHVLSVDTGGHSDTTVGDLISDPGLTGPCGGGGDDSDDGDDGEGGCEGFGDGGRSLVEGFLGGEGGGSLSGGSG